MPNRARQDVAIALGLVVLAWVVFYPGLVFFHEVVYAGDTFTMDLPARLYLAHRLRAGQLPLWYPLDGLGVPLIGSLIFGVFHPFTVLYLFLDTGTALAVSQVLLAGLAVAGTYVLARRLGLGIAGACVAALGFGLGGSFVSSLDHVQFATGIAGFPWFLVGVHLMLGRRPRAGTVVAAVFFALAILGGDVEAAYLYGVLGVAFSFVVPEAPRLRARAGRFAGVAVLGLALAAVQFFPTVAIAGVVYRARGVAWDVASRWSAHPLRLPDLFVGDTLHVTPGANFHLGGLFGLAGAAWYPTIFLGVLVGLGGVLALVLRAGDRRLRLGLAALALVLLIVAMGRYGGLYRLLYLALPGWSRFRYPMKVMPYASLFLLLLGGLGLTEALREPRRAVKPTLVLLGLAVVAVVALRLGRNPAAALVASLARANVARQAVGLVGEFYVARLFVSLAHVALLCLIALGAFLLARGVGTRRTFAAAAILVLAQLGDLTAINGRTLLVTAANRGVFTQPSPFATEIHRRFGTTYGRVRLATLTDQAESVRTPAVIASHGATDLGVIAWQRKALVPDLSGVYGIEPAFPYLPSNLGRFWRHIRGRVGRFTLDEAPMFNAGLLATTEDIYMGAHLPVDHVLKILPEVGLVLGRIPKKRVLPRAFLARPRFVDGESGAAAALQDPAVLSGREAAVEGSPVAPLGAGGGQVRITRYAPETVSIDVDAPAGGRSVLVLNDAWYPGWTARLDGHRVEVRHANLLVRGVLVPPGKHRVVFRYPVPASLAAGAVVTALALLTLVALVVPWPRRRRGGDVSGHPAVEG